MWSQSWSRSAPRAASTVAASAERVPGQSVPVRARTRLRDRARQTLPLFFWRRRTSSPSTRPSRSSPTRTPCGGCTLRTSKSPAVKLRHRKTSTPPCSADAPPVDRAPGAPRPDHHPHRAPASHRASPGSGRDSRLRVHRRSTSRQPLSGREAAPAPAGGPSQRTPRHLPRHLPNRVPQPNGDRGGRGTSPRRLPSLTVVPLVGVGGIASSRSRSARAVAPPSTR